MPIMEFIFAACLIAFGLVVLLKRRRRNGDGNAAAGVAQDRSPPSGPTARIEYVDAEGEVTERTITMLKLLDWRPGAAGWPHGTLAYCHIRRDDRTFLFERIRWLEADGTRFAGGDTAAVWSVVAFGHAAVEPIPERPPGRKMTRAIAPPLEAVVKWQRAGGDPETFEIAIDEVESAGGVPFAFSGRAHRRRSDANRAWTGRRRFKLRGWDTPDAPIDEMFEPEGVEPIKAPHRWLAERTRRKR